MGAHWLQKKTKKTLLVFLNFFYILQGKVSNTGLEWHEGEEIMSSVFLVVFFLGELSL